MSDWSIDDEIIDEDLIDDELDDELIRVRKKKPPKGSKKKGKKKKKGGFMKVLPILIAVILIIAVGGALQAPWDNSWNSPDDYAALQQNVDTVAAVQPIRAENISDVAVDSAHVLMPEQAKN